MKMKFKVSQLNMLEDCGFLEIFLPFYVILSYYVLPAVSSIGMLIIYMYVLVRIIKSILISNDVVYVNKLLLIFVVYAICTQPFIFMVYGGFNSSRLFNLFAIIMMFLVICVCTQKINLDAFFNVYLIVGFICSIAIIFQSLQLYVLGMKVYPIVLLPIDTSSWFNGGTRPCGFFPEPQAYATYILPLLYYQLKKHNLKWVVFFSISILFSTSSLGIIAVVLLFGYYLMSSNTNKVFKIGAIILGLAIFLVIRQTTVYDYAISKILDIDITNNTRLSHGFDVFNKLSFEQKVLGIGKNNLTYFLSEERIVLTDRVRILMRNSAYITSISDILVGFGVIGLLIYILFIVKQIITYDDKMFIFLLLVLSFAQTIFLNSAWIFWMVIYFNMIDIKSTDFYKIRIK